MKYWVFVGTQQKEDSNIIPAREILETRFDDEFWGLGALTPNRKRLQSGDKVVFYEAIPTKSFVATATLKSGYFQLSPNEKKQYSHNGRQVFTTDFGVYLEGVRQFSPIPVEDLVDILSFIENKEYWYSYFTGGIREIFKEDYITITRAESASLVEQIRATKDLQSPSQFALEAHLEEFMFNNWSQIDFGEKLSLYTEGEQSGRQYPAETWSIDFLCLDEKDDFVVIELKRGKTSNATIGQLLTYINWVRENLATAGQKVRGIVIAQNIDNALRYAAMSLPDVRLMTYKVDFHLQG